MNEEKEKKPKMIKKQLMILLLIIILGLVIFLSLIAVLEEPIAKIANNINDNSDKKAVNPPDVYLETPIINWSKDKITATITIHQSLGVIDSYCFTTVNSKPDIESFETFPAHLDKKTKEVPIDENTDTIYFWYYKAENRHNAVNISQKINVGSNLKDKLMLEADPKGWAKSVTITANSIGLEIGKTEFAWSTSADLPDSWSSFSGMSDVSKLTRYNVTQNGTYYRFIHDKSIDIYYRSSIEINNIDEINPTVVDPIMKLGSNTGPQYYSRGWTNSSVYVEIVDGIDNESGHKETTGYMEYDYSGELDQQPISGKSIILSEEGTYTLLIKTTDNLGNTAEKRYYIYIDKTQPSIQFSPYTIREYTKDVSITVNVTDSGGSQLKTSSLAYQWVEISEQPASQGYIPFENGEEIKSPDKKEGEYYLWIIACDYAGNSILQQSNVYYIDNKGPTISFETNGNINWAKEHGTRINVTDCGMGDIGIYNLKYVWTTNSSQPEDSFFANTYTNGEIITKNNETGNNWYLWAMAEDSLGNKTYQRSKVFYFDNAIPTVTSASTSTNWSNMNKTITVTANDVGSGIEGYAITKSNSKPSASSSDWKASTSTTWTSTETYGIGTYYAWVKDKVGHISSVSKSVTVSNIETTLPTITVNSNEIAARSQKATITIGDTGGSGLAKGTYTIKYQWTTTSTTPTNWTNVSTSTSITVEAGASSKTTQITKNDGTNTYYLHVQVTNLKDQAGNIGLPTTYGKFVLDNTGPEITFGTNGNLQWEKSQSTTIGVKEVGGSTVNTNTLKYIWTTNESQPTEAQFTGVYTDGGTVTKNNVTGSNWYLWAKAEDQLGNKTYQRSKVFYFDNAIPTVTSASTSTNWSNMNKRITVTANDVGSGIEGYAITTSNSQSAIKSSDWVTSTATTWTSTETYGTGTYYAWVKDEVGNISAAKGVSVSNIEIIAPTITVNSNTTVAKSQIATITIGDTGGSGLAAGTYAIKYQWTTTTMVPTNWDSISTSTSITVEAGASSKTTQITKNDGTNTYYLHVQVENLTDQAGNTGSPTAYGEFALDNTGPEITFVTNGNSQWAKSQSTKVSAEDVGGSVLDDTSLKYLWTQSIEKPEERDFYEGNNGFANNGTITKSEGTGDNWYLWVLAKDKLTNTAIKRSEAFYLDNTAPIAGTLEMKIGSKDGEEYKNNSWVNQRVYIKQNEGEDPMPGSGHALTIYNIKEGPVKLNEATGPIELSEQGIYKIEVKTTDNLGNTSKNEYTIKIDVTLPTINFNINKNQEYNSSQSTTVTIRDEGGSEVNEESLRYLWTQSTEAPKENEFLEQVNNTFTNGEVITKSDGTGIYYLWILAKDHAGNTIIKGTEEFYLDNTRPQITFEPNGNPTWLTSQNAIVTVEEQGGSELDEDSLKYQWTQSTEKPQEGTFNNSFKNGETITKSNGTGNNWYLWVLAKDKLGNTIIDRSEAFWLDNTPPTAGKLIMKLDSQEGEDYLNNIWTNQDIYIKTEDGTDSDSGHKLTVYDISGPINENNQTGERILTTPGTYKIKVKTTDYTGNETESDEYTIKIDKTKPEVTFELNGNSTWKKSQETTVRVQDDGGSKIKNESLRYLWTQSTEEPLEESFSDSFESGATITKSEITGIWYLWVLAKDYAGNTMITKSEAFYFDNTKPTVGTLKMTKISTGESYNTDSWTNDSIQIKLDSMGNDDESEIKETTYSIAGAITANNQIGTIELNKEGTYTIVITTEDHAGNVTTNEDHPYIVKIDKTEPQIGTLTMKKGSNTGDDYLNNTWTNEDVYIALNNGIEDASDTRSGHASTTYSITGSLTENNKTEQKKFSESGEYTIIVTTTDYAGNVVTNKDDPYKIKIDKIAPKFKVEVNRLNDQIMKATINVTEEGSGLSTTNNYQYYISETKEEIENPNWLDFEIGKSISIQDSSYKKYYLHIKEVSDHVGNISEENVFGPYSNKPISVDFNTDGNKNWSKSHETTVTVTSNIETQVDTLKYKWAQGEITLNEESFNDGQTFNNGELIQSSELTGNDWYLWILAKDEVGNTVIAKSKAFYFDNTAPTITGVTKNPETLTKEKVTLTIQAKDDLSGLAEKPYTFDQGKTWQKENSKIFTENTNEIKIAVKDAVGNIQSYETINIANIDKEAPTITITPNGNTKAVKRQSVVIKVEDNEGGSGLSSNNKYQYYLSTSKTELTGGEWKNYTNGEKFTIGRNLIGTYYLHIREIEDNLGNKSETKVSEAFMFDSRLPEPEELPEITLPDNYEKKEDSDGNNYIEGIKPGLTKEEIEEQIDSEEEFEIVEPDGSKLKDGDPLKTGDRIEFESGGSYTIVVKGDVNGDGEITLVDLARLKLNIVDLKMLIGEFAEAGDLNKDNEITIVDLAMMKKVLIGLIELNN